MIKINKRTATKQFVEPMLPLINVVFLLLVFFMVAGSFNQVPNQHDIPSQLNKSPLKNEEINSLDWLFVDKLGNINFKGQTVPLKMLASVVAGKKQITLSVDKNLSVGKLGKMTSILRQNNVEELVIVTKLEVNSPSEFQ